MLTVPPGAKAGDALAFTLPDGRQMSLTVPDGARPGDRLSVPNASAAATGGSMTITVPEGSRPGDSLSFSTEQAPPPEKASGGWFGGREKPAPAAPPAAPPAPEPAPAAKKISKKAPPPIAAPAMGADGIPVGSPGPGMAGSPRTFHMKLPADARRGHKIQVRAPSGELMVFKVPRNARPGQTLHFP